ncbi:hypothetical protein H310_00798 [Aphanomyces invadans]|uniref:Uncharacterized protein n=1 Tax=Aphanomyces invadans TaxID=157072 RepID=A0A024UVF8_9STRA|nr:hypothetical protein H310_00798 [Aphanomyces invadans]ETW10511.1 hypothetical protein H310_00798 [Aphanomyces invadans]|eukprot:XP_008861922.1 hypothetical protein H310_00798 [Aphanomyces invadans]
MTKLTVADEEVLAKDREEHPECTYSTTISSSCRSVHGDRQCETLRRIFRNCPGRPRKLILDVKDETQDNSADSSVDGESSGIFPDPFQLFRGRSAHSHGDNEMSRESGVMGNPFDSMDDLMQEMLRPFGFSSFGNFGFGPHDQEDSAQFPFHQPPPHNTPPPHRGYSRHPPANAKVPPRNKDMFDGFDGPVEEI